MILTITLLLPKRIFGLSRRKLRFVLCQSNWLGTQSEFLGISELCYVESKDMILFTFTSEGTNNAYDDGVIGSSYIGWVNNVAAKLKQD